MNTPLLALLLIATPAPVQAADRAVPAADAPSATEQASQASKSAAQGASPEKPAGGDDTPVTATGSRTPRTLAARFGEVLNVRDFGAKCDSKTGTDGADDTAAIQAAIRYGLSHSTVVRLPSGMCRTTATLTVTDSGLVLRGNGQFGMGGSAIAYNGTGTALRVKKAATGYVYASEFSDFSVQGFGGAERAFELVGASEIKITNVGIGGVRSSRFGTGFYFEDAHIVEVLHPYVNGTGVAMHFANAPGQRHTKINAEVTVHNGDFYDNGTALMVNSLVKGDFSSNWFESQDYLVRFDDTSAAGRHVEVENLFFHHNTALFNVAAHKHQHVAYWKARQGSLHRTMNVVFDSNRIFRAAVTEPPTAPFLIDVGGADPRSVVRLLLAQNHAKHGAPALVSSDSALAQVALRDNQNLDSSSWLPVADVEGTAQWSITKQVGNGLTVGPNGTDSAATLTVHGKLGPSALKVREGDAQADRPLVAWHDKDDGLLGGVDAHGGLFTAKGLRIGTGGGAAPACDSAHGGTFWYAPGGRGMKDTVQVCAKDASNSWAWRLLY